jgi:hypothetical protein
MNAAHTTVANNAGMAGQSATSGCHFNKELFRGTFRE